MLRFVFIGAKNQTNSIVLEELHNHFNADIEVIPSSGFFEKSQNTLNNNADLVIFDCNTSPGHGNIPQKVTHIAGFFEDTPVLVMQPYLKEKFSQPLLQAGADGVISTTPAPQELVEAVNALLTADE